MTTPLRPIRTIAEVEAGIPVLPASPGEDGGALVYALMPASLKTDGAVALDRENLREVRLAKVPDLRHRVASGDILITAKSTESSLRCGYVADSTLGKSSPSFASSLVRLRPKADSLVLPGYLHAWLSSPVGKAALLAESRSATHQLNLTTSSISEISVPVPSLEEQRRIVEFLDGARSAHECAIAAAHIRLALAQEIAFLKK